MDSDDWKELREDRKEAREQRADDAVDLVEDLRRKGFKVKEDIGHRYEITRGLKGDADHVRLYFYPKGDRVHNPIGNRWRSHAAAWITLNLLRDGSKG